MRRPTYIFATADETNAVLGVAVAGSYQMTPQTLAPWKVHGRADTGKTKRYVQIALTEAEARKLVADWVNMGLFGPRARIETRAGEAA